MWRRVGVVTAAPGPGGAGVRTRKPSKRGRLAWGRPLRWESAKEGLSESPPLLPASVPASLCVSLASFRSKRSSEKFRGDLRQAEGEGLSPAPGEGRAGQPRREPAPEGADARAGRWLSRGADGPGRRPSGAPSPGRPARPSPAAPAPAPRAPPPRLRSAPRAGSASAAAFPERQGCARVPVRRETEGHRSPRLPEPRSREPPQGCECAPDPKPALHASTCGERPGARWRRGAGARPGVPGPPAQGWGWGRGARPSPIGRYGLLAPCLALFSPDAPAAPQGEDALPPTLPPPPTGARRGLGAFRAVTLPETADLFSTEGMP